MKLNRTARRANGMTFLEVGVVIVVLFSLGGILFVGARGKMQGSDRAANIMNIRNVQQAVRAEQGMQGMRCGDPLPAVRIFGNGSTIEGYLKEPVPPKPSLTYSYGTKVPEMGTLYLNVTGVDADEYAPAAGTYTDW